MSNSPWYNFDADNMCFVSQTDKFILEAIMHCQPTTQIADVNAQNQQCVIMKNNCILSPLFLCCTEVHSPWVHGLPREAPEDPHECWSISMLQRSFERWQTWWSHKNDILLVAICTSHSAQRLLVTLTNGSIWCGLGANHHLLRCQTGFSRCSEVALPSASFFRITWALVPWKANALTPHVVFVRPIHCLGIMKAPTSDMLYQERLSMGTPKKGLAILISLCPALTQDLGPLWLQGIWS